MTSMIPLTGNPPPQEGVSVVVDDVKVFFNKDLFGTATLYIARDGISWVMDSGQSFTLSPNFIDVHALSRDTADFPHECLLLIVEADVSLWAESVVKKGPSPSNSPDDAATTELRFVPREKSRLEQMFKGVSNVQAHTEFLTHGRGPKTEKSPFEFDAMYAQLEEENDDTYAHLDDEDEEDYFDSVADADNELHKEYETLFDTDYPAELDMLDEGEKAEPGAGRALTEASDIPGVSYIRFCPDESEMTQEGLANLKRLEASLARGAVSKDDAVYEEAESVL